MKPVSRGIAVAVLQCLIVLSAFGKYAVDRTRLPRVWVKTAPIDPNLPMRGRYLSLRLEVETAAVDADSFGPARLSIHDGRLFAERADVSWESSSARILQNVRGKWTLAAPVAFFLPEHAADPSIRPTGEELWVEVSLPQKGPPRPIRLGVKRDGILKPL